MPAATACCFPHLQDGLWHVDADVDGHPERLARQLLLLLWLLWLLLPLLLLPPLLLHLLLPHQLQLHLRPQLHRGVLEGGWAVKQKQYLVFLNRVFSAGSGP